MRLPFRELPDAEGGYLRPVVGLHVEGLDRTPQFCLLDSGSLHNRFGGWLAEAAGIEPDPATETRIALGGTATIARRSAVRLTLADITWQADVWFCDPWPWSFHLLGQEGFFNHFDVRIRAARYELEITPET